MYPFHCIKISYNLRNNRFSEHEDTAIEEPLTCESPEPMSCYLHHDPDHPISSFSVINKMRVNIQVRQLSTEIYNNRFELYYVVRYSNFFQYNSQLCDVSLRVGDSVTKAHRLVLASSSPYFYAMFNGECDKFFLFIKTFSLINRRHG